MAAETQRIKERAQIQIASQRLVAAEKVSGLFFLVVFSVSKNTNKNRLKNIHAYIRTHAQKMYM